MEVEIVSKKNNPLLNRTEIHFNIKHPGEKTPNREIIRTELAEKLNAKKEEVIVNDIHTTFGKQEITGYAKIYTSLEKSKGIEHDHILVRNKLMDAKKKEKKGAKAKPAEAPREVAKPAPKVEAPNAEAPKPEPAKDKKE